MDFKTADFLRATKGNDFISDLMPKCPIYVDLLPDAAKSVIGKANEFAMPAMHVLQKEGFKYQNYIDIFNAGPDLEIAKKDLKTVRESKIASITIIDSLKEGTLKLISNKKEDYRVLFAPIELKSDRAFISKETAFFLEVSNNDLVRYCDLI